MNPPRTVPASLNGFALWNAILLVLMLLCLIALPATWLIPVVRDGRCALVGALQRLIGPPASEPRSEGAEVNEEETSEADRDGCGTGRRCALEIETTGMLAKVLNTG